jgi:hypothetical protein
MTLLDGRSGVSTGVSSISGYLSDAAFFHERIATPDLRLFRLAGSRGRANVLADLKTLPDDENVRHGLLFPRTLGVNLHRQALAVRSDVRHARVPEGACRSRALIERAEGNRIELRAEGPGVLVIAEGWDKGWKARVNDQAHPLFRVNHAQIGCILPPGMHRVSLRYHARGLSLGVALAVLSAIGLLWNTLRPQ